MPVAKQVQTQNFGFLSLSKKMFLYSSLIAFLLVLIGAAVAGISAMVAGAAIGIGIGLAMVYFGKLWLTCGFALYGITSREDAFVKAGLFVASGIILASL
jgi:hypothetical protein